MGIYYYDAYEIRRYGSGDTEEHLKLFTFNSAHEAISRCLNPDDYLCYLKVRLTETDKELFELNPYTVWGDLDEFLRAVDRCRTAKHIQLGKEFTEEQITEELVSAQFHLQRLTR